MEASVGDEFVAANATIETLEGVLSEKPRDMDGERAKWLHHRVHYLN